MKALAGDKSNMDKMPTSAFERTENVVGEKKKMLVSRIFPFSHNLLKSFLKGTKNQACLYRR